MYGIPHLIVTVDIFINDYRLDRNRDGKPDGYGYGRGSGYGGYGAGRGAGYGGYGAEYGSGYGGNGYNNRYNDGYYWMWFLLLNKKYKNTHAFTKYYHGT